MVLSLSDCDPSRYETDVEAGSDIGRIAGGAGRDWFAGWPPGSGGASRPGSSSQSAMFERRAAMLDGDACVREQNQTTTRVFILKRSKAVAGIGPGKIDV